MTVERVQRPSDRSADEQARLDAIRRRFQRDRPTLANLVEEQDYNEAIAHGDFLAFRQAILTLKAAREAAGLSLEEVAQRSGIDKAALSRLETGKSINPTLTTLSRYAHAVGKQIRWTIEDFQGRPSPGLPEGAADREQGSSSGVVAPAS